MEQNSVYHPAKKNMKRFAASLKAIFVVNGYEELAESYSM